MSTQMPNVREIVLRCHIAYTARRRVKTDTNSDRASIFEGEFLDPVASTIFGIFLFVGAYFFGFVRAKKPRL